MIIFTLQVRKLRPRSVGDLTRSHSVQMVEVSFNLVELYTRCFYTSDHSF